MTGQVRPRLADEWECFEGIIPTVIVTAARDGTPNVSYISHVYLIDEDHVALSNQFMSKLVRNVMENPRLQAVVGNGATGRQLVLDLMFERSEASGPLFDKLAVYVTAVASHQGMDHVMRLRAADIYRVLSVEAGTLPSDGLAGGPQRPDLLGPAAGLSLTLARTEDLDRAIDIALDGLHRDLGLKHCMIFLADPDRQAMTAVASRGYARQGAGAEVRWGQGVVGQAAAWSQSLRFSSVGRSFLYVNAVKAAEQFSPDPARQIPMPGLEAPQSLLAIPMIAGGEVRGLIFAEALDRLAFSPADERAVSLVAAQLGALVALNESSRELDAALSRTAPTAAVICRSGPPVQVRHYAYDDSVFVGQDYIIKGVPGRLLWRMLRIFVTEGRAEFTNREFRLDPAMKLPDFKDNLETRLLLLTRRLAENDWPIRITRTGRGRMVLEVDGSVELIGA